MKKRHEQQLVCARNVLMMWLLVAGVTVAATQFAALVQDEVGNLHLNTSALAPGSTVLVNGVDVLGFLAEHEQVLWMHEELLRELRTTVLALGQDVDALKGSSSTTAAPGSTQADPAATADPATTTSSLSPFELLKALNSDVSLLYYRNELRFWRTAQSFTFGPVTSWPDNVEFTSDDLRSIDMGDLTAINGYLDLDGNLLTTIDLKNLATVNLHIRLNNNNLASISFYICGHSFVFNRMAMHSR